MRLKDVAAANIAAKHLSDLEHDYDLASNKGLGITIQGKYQDDQFVDDVRDAVLLVLKRRIDTVREGLKKLGVTDAK